MNCSVCKKQYETDKVSLNYDINQNKSNNMNQKNILRRIPRILTACGHTLCQDCIKKQLQMRVNLCNYFKCGECGKANYGEFMDDFPINATLVNFLQQSQQQKSSLEKNNSNLQIKSRQSSSIQHKNFCAIHKLKFEAYCQKDKQLLCINCIINGNSHKNHNNKILPISQVVLKERKNFKQNCEQKIRSGKQQLQVALNKIAELQDRIDQQYKDYLFEVSLFYKNVRQQIQQCQHNALQKSRRVKESIRYKLAEKSEQFNDRKKFLMNLEKIYMEVTNPQLSDIDYLVEMENKRNFVMQNCKIKKTKIGCPHLQFDKLTEYQDLISLFYNYVNSQKKSNLSATGTLTKELDIRQYVNESKSKQIPRLSLGSNHKRQKQGKVAISSNRQSNNTSLNMNRGKVKVKQGQKVKIQQPTILQVNLAQRYQKHYSSRSNKRSSETVNESATNDKQKNCQRRTKQINLTRYQSNAESQRKQQNFNFKKLKSNESPSLNKEFEEIYIQQKQSNHNASFNANQSNHNTSFNANTLINLDFSYFSARESSKSFQADNQNFQTNVFDADICKNPIKGQNKFENIPRFSAVSSIQSFMDQSHSSLLNSLKGSRADFTLISTSQKVYHFGGFNDNPIESTVICPFNLSKQEFSQKQQTYNLTIGRNKSQCVVYNSYSNSKCLILGGVDHKTGERLNSILQFDFKTQKISKSPLYLSQGKSGFGVICKDGRLFIFGGRAEQINQKDDLPKEAQSVKTTPVFEEYTIGNSGLQLKKLQKMHSPRQQHGYALGLDGYIYACGGINSKGTVLITCQRYSFAKKRWQPISNMHSPRRSFTLLAVPSGLIAIGGHDGKKYLKSVQKYSYKEAKWIQLNQMSVQRCAHSAVVSSDYQEIWVFGGFGRSQHSFRENSDMYQPLDDIQVYSIIENEWKTEGKLKEKRFLHCSILGN